MWAGSLGHTVALRDYIYVRGELWLIFALVVTWAYDTGAYLVGRSIGKRRIFQHLSAGKTLEGTLGGAFIAVTVAALYAQFTPFPLSPILAGLLGLGTAVVAQLGDLVESLLKRGADAKESGTLIPGHGGVLDRIDSLLFTGPFMFYVALIWASLQLGSAIRARLVYSPTAISTTGRPSSSTQTPQGPPRSLLPSSTTLPSMRSTGW